MGLEVSPELGFTDLAAAAEPDAEADPAAAVETNAAAGAVAGAETNAEGAGVEEIKCPKIDFAILRDGRTSRADLANMAACDGPNGAKVIAERRNMRIDARK